ncbi:hypothetical protein MBO_07263 [Moraxella bovoculi 237]|uniref:Bestrophin n=1 Tax=Moraxella bovoculi 237 TaxID=743974 RepID=A0A066UBH3_9GAMM|nr:bestrophin family protein [Moraxella bovoculi]KDN24746.1 hypothetical protein MBO_07263 [Moraxella bovoculi 237]
MIVRDKSNSLKLLFVWRGTILPKVLPMVLILMAVSMVAWMLTHYKVYTVTGVPAVGFTVFGVVLSIFLGFRNTACYDRWWEGRKLWGAMIANTRHLTRDSHFLEPYQRDKLLTDMLIFIGLLRNRLRGQSASIEQFTHYHPIDQDEIDRFNQHINAPQLLLERMQLRLMDAVKSGSMTDIIYTSVQRHVVEMGSIQAGCDRIASTPLPFPYSVLLHRAVFCFCWMLPFGLESVMGIWTPFLVGFLSYLLLGLDELSYQLEEPFGTADNDLPLDTMVRLMERETLALLNNPIPDAISADQYYNYS